MISKHRIRARALMALEIAFVGLLGWALLSGDATFWGGQKVQAASSPEPAGTPQHKHKQRTKPDERAVPAEGRAAVTSLAAFLSQAGTPVSCQGFDFQDGTAQGFTVVDVQPVPGTPPLWHVSNNTCRSNLAGHSVPYDFYYGLDASCNYNTGTRNASNLISPSISLAGRTAPFTLGFNYLLFVESSSSFDTAFVDVSTDGGMTWTQVLSKANFLNDNQWHNVVADITTAVGTATSIQLRFRFDTVDNLVNSSTGWHVDDIIVCGKPPFCLQDDSSGSFLQWDTAGNYFFTNCHGVTVGGKGTVTVRGSIVTLADSSVDRRIQATYDGGAKRGSATIQLFPSGTSFTITDRNTANDTCMCAP